MKEDRKRRRKVEEGKDKVGGGCNGKNGRKGGCDG